MGTMYTCCSDAVSELLRSCSDLRSLKGEGLAIGPRAIRDGCAWACHKIEISETHFGDADDDDDEEGKYFLQQVVYNQLAQLTRLRSLDMSIACSYSDLPRLCVMQLVRSHQYLRHPVNEDAVVPMDTLQFTLAAGLGRLSSLSQLDELRIRGVDHRIWKEELLWMQEHRPRLKWIRGVALRIEGVEEMRVGRTWYVEDGIADLLD
ncbi:MAG: hypothetical protein BYD32DRAFT_406779 [Podila humilis]|nr:MAG: hypothetical protein BYD32DRAFT_406779 [Podila humilis]